VSILPGAVASFASATLYQAQTMITTFLVFCALLLLPMTVPPIRFFVGGAHLRRDWKMTFLAVLLFAGFVATATSHLGQVSFDLAGLDLQDFAIAGACGVVWMFLTLWAWRYQILERFLGLPREGPGGAPGVESRREARRRKAAAAAQAAAAQGAAGAAAQGAHGQGAAAQSESGQGAAGRPVAPVGGRGAAPAAAGTLSSSVNRPPAAADRPASSQPAGNHPTTPTAASSRAAAPTIPPAAAASPAAGVGLARPTGPATPATGDEAAPREPRTTGPPSELFGTTPAWSGEGLSEPPDRLPRSSILYGEADDAEAPEAPDAPAGPRPRGPAEKPSRPQEPLPGMSNGTESSGTSGTYAPPRPRRQP
jgi:hypothetical protein